MNGSSGNIATAVVEPPQESPPALSTPRRVARALRWRAGRSVDAVVAASRTSRNAARRLLGLTDHARWSAQENLESWWEARTRKMAELIPKNTTVIEFGAGTRTLERLLHPGCKYIPSDLVDRGLGTVVLDLNRRPLPDLSGLGAEVAVFAGVLEYMRDMEGLVAWLSKLVQTCVLSYEPVVPTRRWTQRFRQSTRRVYLGYMNGYSETELLEIFDRAGFDSVTRDSWMQQQIFLMVKRGGAA